MQDPLKQGLKRVQFFPQKHLTIHSNARSTKTRIETTEESKREGNFNHIRMQDPLKQGLKLLRFLYRSSACIIIRMQDPLKQGLKHGSYR